MVAPGSRRPIASGRCSWRRQDSHPRVAIDFWERMEQTTRGGSPELLSTHPSHRTRITQLRAWIPEVMRLYAATAPAPNAPLVCAGNVKRGSRARVKKFRAPEKIFLEDARDVTASRHDHDASPPCNTRGSAVNADPPATYCFLEHGASEGLDAVAPAMGAAVWGTGPGGGRSRERLITQGVLRLLPMC